MLIRRPTSQLHSDDLPTFGRQTIATTGKANAISKLCVGDAKRKLRASPQRVPAIDHHGRAGHVARSIARQIDRQRADFVRFAEPAHRYLTDEDVVEFGLLAEPAAAGGGQEAATGDGGEADGALRP